jgi:predicted peptidase
MIDPGVESARNQLILLFWFSCRIVLSDEVEGAMADESLHNQERMMLPILIRSFAILIIGSCFAYSEQVMAKPKQNARTFSKRITTRVKADYLLFLPDGFDSKKKERWPLIFFLHGMGERGSDPWKVKVHGPPKVAEKMADFPFIVVSPQCPDDEWWSSEVLTALLDEIIGRHKIDTNRIYLTGLSMGGYGAWSLALERPERFAAVAVVCGGGNPNYFHSYGPARKAALKSLPFWVFHGDKDNSVPLDESQRMVAALKKFGCDVRFTIYPGVEHDSWTQTYANPELYEWFLGHKRQPPSR